MNQQNTPDLILSMELKVGDVIMLNDHVCVVKEVIRAKDRRRKPNEIAKYYVSGIDIFTNRKRETLCVGKDTFAQITPTQLTMEIMTINNDNTCDLQYDDNIIKNVIISSNYITKFNEYKNEGFKVMAVVDNYMDAFYKIKKIEI